MALQIAVSKALASSSSATATADVEYDKLTDPSKTTPTPPVLAARLSALMKSLANAEGAVSQSIKARRALLEDLEKLLETNKAALAVDETKHAELTQRKAAMEARKREVEDGIVRGLSSDTSLGLGGVSTSAAIDPSTNVNGGSDLRPPNNGTVVPGLEPPPTEDLTPPPMESLTPVGSPRASTDNVPTSARKVQEHAVSNQANVAHATTQPSPHPQPVIATAGADLLSSLSMPPVRHYAGSGSGSSPGTMGGGSAFKKRKLEADFAVFGAGEDAMADLDADVAELLRAESGGAH